MCGIGLVVEGLHIVSFESDRTHDAIINDVNKVEHAEVKVDELSLNQSFFFEESDANNIDSNNKCSLQLSNILPTAATKIHYKKEKNGSTLKENDLNAFETPIPVHETHENSSNNFEDFLKILAESLHRRGPDKSGVWTSNIYQTNKSDAKFIWEPTKVHLFGSVLHMSGSQMTAQPVQLIDGSQFVYNGEIFGFRHHSDPTIVSRFAGGTDSYLTASGDPVLLSASNYLFSNNSSSNNENSSMSDTSWLQIQINEILTKSSDVKSTDHRCSDFDIALRNLLERIEGPFSFIHYCPRRQRIFCMRDMFGRRSLCVNIIDLREDGKDDILSRSSDFALCIANVAMSPNALELPCSGAFVFELQSRTCQKNIDSGNALFDKYCIRHLVRSEMHQSPFQKNLLDKFWKVNADFNITKKDQNESSQTPSPNDLEQLDHSDNGNNYKKDLFLFGKNRSLFRKAFTNAINRHISGHTHIALLYSGGVDSSVIAAVTAQELQKEHLKKKSDVQTKPVLELINVTFDPEKGPDRHTALCSLKDLFTTCVPKTAPDVRYELFLVDKCYNDLKPEKVMRLLGSNSTVMDYNIATALWCGSHGCGYRLRWWPELVQLTFPKNSSPDDKVKSNFRKSNDGMKPNYSTDTQGQDAVEVQQEMKILYELMIQANVPLFKKPGSERRNTFHHYIPKQIESSSIDVEECNGDNISVPIFPCIPQKSLSNSYGKINCNLYTDQYAVDSHRNNLPSAKGRVLLVGHGADELMGGYARHISAFEKRGHEGLINEMGLDLDRLWQRNLGRDDRVLSDFGRETRHPFLDEEFIECIRTLPPLVDKMYLRDLASTRDIGLHSSAARFEKRAIQFGTRIAQRSNKALVGTNRKGKGTDKFIMK